jgi:hypothetical protein
VLTRAIVSKEIVTFEASFGFTIDPMNATEEEEQVMLDRWANLIPRTWEDS